VALSHRLPYFGSEWIERVRAGNEAAFESLFRTFAPGLCVLATRYVQSRAVAEELVQDLFFDLWSRRSELVIEGTIAAYLATATRNRALNHLKRDRLAARWRATSAPPSEVDLTAPTESDLLDALELQDAIDQLPVRCRLIFNLSRQQDMTYADIAKSLGLSIKTVETQMGRALKVLRERLRHLG
jgi:RNA polymerase sigma-70 factor, ECF subfamily